MTDKKIFAGILIVILIIAVAGILIMSSGAGGTEKTTFLPQTTTRVIQDNDNRTVTIPVQPARIIVTVPWMLSITSAIQGRDLVVGITTETTKDYGFNQLFPSWINSKPAVGSFNELNTESVLKVNPDLVISQTGKAVTQMEGMDVPVVVVSRMPEIPENIRFIGSVIGRTAQAEALATYYERKVDLARSRTAGIDPDQQKTVYYIAGTVVTKTAGKDFGNYPLVRYAGGRLVTEELKGGSGTEISIEQLMEWNPDVIVVAYGWGLTPEDVLDDPRLQDITAVKNRAVYLEPPPHAACLKKHPSSCLGVLWLAQKMYPDLFTDVDIQKESQDFVQNFYGVKWDATFE